jgi:peptidoglycan hydrolase CwlO-like protein
MTRIRVLLGALAVLVVFAAGCGLISDQNKKNVKNGQEDLKKKLDDVQKDVNDLKEKVNELLKKVDAKEQHNQ